MYLLFFLSLLRSSAISLHSDNLVMGEIPVLRRVAWRRVPENFQLKPPACIRDPASIYSNKLTFYGVPRFSAEGRIF